MINPEDARDDFSEWADETGYPLFGEPGSLVGEPIGPDPEDPLIWVEQWENLGNIPIMNLLTPEEIESFRPPDNPNSRE